MILMNVTPLVQRLLSLTQVLRSLEPDMDPRTEISIIHNLLDSTRSQEVLVADADARIQEFRIYEISYTIRHIPATAQGVRMSGTSVMRTNVEPHGLSLLLKCEEFIVHYDVMYGQESARQETEWAIRSLDEQARREGAT